VSSKPGEVQGYARCDRCASHTPSRPSRCIFTVCATASHERGSDVGDGRRVSESSRLSHKAVRQNLGYARCDGCVRRWERPGRAERSAIERRNLRHFAPTLTTDSARPLGGCATASVRSERVAGASEDDRFPRQASGETKQPYGFDFHGLGSLETKPTARRRAGAHTEQCSVGASMTGWKIAGVRHLPSGPTRI
jgi:hypothetical protein